MAWDQVKGANPGCRRFFISRDREQQPISFSSEHSHFPEILAATAATSAIAKLSYSSCVRGSATGSVAVCQGSLS